jgi:hypothetical protein
MQVAQIISDTAVANFAAGVLDNYAVTAIDENTSLGRFFQREYTFVRDEVLQTYPWAFAKKRALLAANLDVPAFGYASAYQLPTDCLRLLPLTVDGKEDAPSVKYELEGREVLCDVRSVLPIRYIRQVTNAAEFTPLFARVLGARLAMMAATRITGKSGYFDKASGLYREAITEARLVDSLERGTPSDYANETYKSTYTAISARGI